MFTDKMNKLKSNVVSFQDFNNICRFCFKKAVGLKPIFTVTNENEVTIHADKVIRECLNLLVNW